MTTARTGDTQVGSTSGSAAPARPLTARGCAGARRTRGVPTCAGVSGRGGAGASPRSLVRGGSPTPGLEPRGPRALSDSPAALSGSSGENVRHRGGWKSIGPCGPGSARRQKRDRPTQVHARPRDGGAHARTRGARAHGGGTHPAAASRANGEPVPERGRAAAATADTAEQRRRQPRRLRSSRNGRRASGAGERTARPRPLRPRSLAARPRPPPTRTPPPLRSSAALRARGRRLRRPRGGAASGGRDLMRQGRASSGGGRGCVWGAGPDTAGTGLSVGGRGLRRSGRAPGV